MRDMTRAKLVTLLVWALAAPCCAGYTAGIRPDEKYNPSNSYLYGRFVVDAKSAPLSFASSQSMGFTVICRDGKTYTIGFSNQTTLQIIKVAPSACQIDEIVYSDSDGIVRGREMAPFRLLRNEFLGPGACTTWATFLPRHRQNRRQATSSSTGNTGQLGGGSLPGSRTTTPRRPGI